MEKARNLGWFNMLQQTKMLKHEEDPCALSYKELLESLEGEVSELKDALTYESRENAIKESADVANYAYFIADKIKRGR